MWVMFPIDSLIGATRHMDDRLPGVVNLARVYDDRPANDAIRTILDNSKRK
jgi:hypothetical protein